MTDGVIGTYSKQLSPEDQARVAREVSYFNNKLNNGKELKKILGQDDFLHLLITELQNQDPTAPMNDKESIAQMAQFSSLEQMTKMIEAIVDVSRLMAKTQAYSLLGKGVEIGDGKNVVQGIIQEVQGGDSPQVLVNGIYYDFNNIKRVTNVEKGE
jgi:flagellar basal-body rod modification protein FlgD